MTIHMKEEKAIGLTINDVKEVLKNELAAAQADWTAAREVLTAKTKARAKVQHRINMFEAQLKRAQDAALGKFSE